MHHALKLTLLCSCWVSGQAIAGAVLKTETREYHVEPPAIGTTNILAEGAMLRIEINSVSSQEDGLIIYRGDRDEILVTDNERLEYYVIGRRNIKRLAEQMLKQQLPETQFEPEAPGTLRKTGKADAINGFSCERYEVVKQGRKTREMCVARWNNIAGGAEAAEAVNGIGRFFESMHDAFAAVGVSGFMDDQREFFKYIRELGGYPVYSRVYDESGALAQEASLLSSHVEAVAADRFEPPAGYRRRQMTQ
jgi:Domain of unknown function (DUF4412)